MMKENALEKYRFWESAMNKAAVIYMDVYGWRNLPMYGDEHRLHCLARYQRARKLERQAYKSLMSAPL